MMLSRFFVLGVCCLLCCSTFAQIEVKVGINAERTDNYSNNTSRFSPSIGASYDILLSKHWKLRPSLMLSEIGEKLIKKEIYDISSGYTYLYGIEIPADFVFSFSSERENTFYINAGPYYRYNLWGWQKTHFDTKPDLSESVFGDYWEYKRSNFGMNIGLGYTWKKFDFNLNFERSLCHIDKRNTEYSQAYRLNIGYRF